MAIVIGGNITFGGGITISNRDTVVAISANGSPAVYRWNDVTGFGTKYSAPSVTAGNSANGTAFHPAGNAIALGNGNTPYIHVWAWDYSTGFGTKYTNPASPPDVVSVDGVQWSPDGSAIAMAGDTDLVSNNMLTVYMWDSSTGFGTKYIQNSNSYGAKTVSWSPDGTAITIPRSTGYNGASYQGYATVYKWAPSGGFLAGNQSVSYVDSRVFDTAFNPAGTAIAIGLVDQTPKIEVYAWTYAGGFGTKYADPSTLPAGYVLSANWSPDGSVIAVASASSPYILAYPWNDATGFGTKYSNPATLPTAITNPVAFNPNGTAIFAGVSGSVVAAYQWSNSTGFGTKYSNPSGGENGYAPQGIAFI